MLYFLPVWYENEKFNENEQAWYSRRLQSEFDDTVKQVQLFQRKAKYPYKIILTSFNPNFRHFLHRQGVYHAPYWSCFDAICEIERTKARMFSVHDLAWPEGIEFVYNPFVLIAKLNGEKYAQVEYGEDGNPIRIIMYQEGTVVRCNNYDDRGFVGSSVVYENNVPVYEDYLMEKGQRKFRYFYNDGHIEINPEYPNYIINSDNAHMSRGFNKMTYNSMLELVQEVLKAYFDNISQDDTFCVAISDLQATLLAPLLGERKLIFSFFSERISEEEIRKHWNIIRDANYLITDSKENSELLYKLFGDKLPALKDISPYDTRVDFGISQQLKVQNILVPVDDMSSEQLDSLIVILGRYLMENKYARIHLFTRSADYMMERKLLDRVEMLFDKYGINDEWVENYKLEDHTKERFLEENPVEEDMTIETRFFVDQCVDELSVSKCMKEQRLIVDLRPVPELYLQIAAISMGLPQIVMKETQFIEDGKNGRVIQSLDKLPSVLFYYLDGLNNWNHAMVEAYELGKKYTTGVLLSAWKEVIEAIG